MAITKEIAEEHLNAWLAAELAVSQAQSYSIGERTLTRANLNEIRSQIKFWEQKLNQLKRGNAGIRVRRSVPKY